MSDNKITLTLSMEQANLILDALGQQPFIKVYELIDHIQRQASEQLVTKDDLKKNSVDSLAVAKQ